jgi:uncharacterized protein (TIGR00297 family)
MVPRGTEGAVSLEGTVSGIIGSILLSWVSLALGLIPSWTSVAVCVAAAFIATTTESFVGALLQNKVAWLNNEVVNLFMTLVGAAVAIALGGIFVEG